MEIVKKCTKDFFEDISSGKKNFDVRLADFECEEGDVLVLKEIDDNKTVTGREIRKNVKYLLRTNNFKFYNQEDIDKFGYQIIGF